MPCEARPNREQFARRAFARAPSAHPPTVARAPRTRNRAIVGVKTANAHALTPCDTMQTERPWSSCPRRFGHSGAAASRWGLCLFSRVRRRQHHPRAGFAEPSCRAARIEPEDHRPDPDPRKTCSGTPSWFPAVWPIAPRHPSRSDSDAERPSGRYLTAGPMVRIRFPPAKSPVRTQFQALRAVSSLRCRCSQGLRSARVQLEGSAIAGGTEEGRGTKLSDLCSELGANLVEREGLIAGMSHGFQLR
jgi:hypothetical protein